MNCLNVYKDPSIVAIRNDIRYGKFPNNPELIALWLTQESVLEDSIDCLSKRRQHYESQFRLLLEVVVDELVPRHWRCLCLDYIYKPLGSIKRLSNDIQSENHLRKLFNELSTSCRYVAATLNADNTQ